MRVWLPLLLLLLVSIQSSPTAAGDDTATEHQAAWSIHVPPRQAADPGGGPGSARVPPPQAADPGRDPGAARALPMYPVSITQPFEGETVECTEVWVTVGWGSPQQPTQPMGEGAYLYVLLGGEFRRGIYLPARTRSMTTSLGALRPGAYELQLVGSREDVTSPSAPPPYFHETRAFATACSPDRPTEHTRRPFASPDPTGAFLTARLPPLVTNPLQPELLLMHGPVFLRFAQAERGFDPLFHVDFLGIETSTDFAECQGGSQLSKMPSRHHACVQHERRVWTTPPGTPIRGHLPIVDDEYAQWESCLAAAVGAAGAHDRIGSPGAAPRGAASGGVQAPPRGGGSFVAVELGAWYGPWAMRAAAAYRLLQPNGTLLVVGVEPEKDRVGDMKRHWARNGVPEGSMRAVHGLVGAAGGGGEGGAPVLGLEEVVELAGGSAIDYLDLDVQGAEGPFLLGREEVPSLLQKHVKRIQVGTHGLALHRGVRSLLESAGFEVDIDLPTCPDMWECDKHLVKGLQTNAKCLTATRHGQVYVRDGLIGASNPLFEDAGKVDGVHG